jgi:hypothetical protein
MFNRRQFIQGAAGAVAGSGLVSVPAFADISYPDRPIHIVIGFPAGSGADILCRWYARKLEELCGQPVIMDNKPGASGNIATRYAARATPDGYTISLISNSSMVGAKFLFKDLQFDAVKDFMPIATFAQIGFVLVVSPKSPLKTVSDLTAHLKEKKDNIFGYTNPTGLLSAELYKQLSGVPAKGVSYRTAPDTMRGRPDSAGRIEGARRRHSDARRHFPRRADDEGGRPQFQFCALVGRLGADGNAAARGRQARGLFHEDHRNARYDRILEDDRHQPAKGWPERNSGAARCGIRNLAAAGKGGGAHARMTM